MPVWYSRFLPVINILVTVNLMDYVEILFSSLEVIGKDARA